MQMQHKGWQLLKQVALPEDWGAYQEAVHIMLREVQNQPLCSILNGHNCQVLEHRH